VEQHPHAKHGHEQTNIKANSPHLLLGSNRRSKYQTLSSPFLFPIVKKKKKKHDGPNQTKL
jgi:hypothetical protein